MIKFVRVLNDHGNAYEVDPAHPGGSSSYHDVWQLVRLSGFPIIELGEIDFDSDDTFVFFPANGNSAAALRRPHKCKLIHWNLERQIGDSIQYADEVWVGDRYYAQMAHHSKVKHVPLGGHKNLGGIPLLPKMYDYIHLSYAYGVREHNINETAKYGFTIAPNTFDLALRDIYLAHSRWGLSLHQTPEPIIEPPRYVLFACWKLPIVAESVVDSFPYKTIPWDPAGHRITTLDPGYIQDLAEDNYQMMTGKYSFRNCVEKAVESKGEYFG